MLSLDRELFLLTEDKNTGKWRERVMCFGDRQYCTDGQVGGLPRYILSFGEDEQGEYLKCHLFNSKD